MPLDTNFNVSPYFDDYDPTKDYYRILFRPGVSVQVRELNQIQDMIQNQIEQFGDNVYKRGTIINGCNFSFFASYPYAKLLDTDLNNAPLNVGTVNGKYVKSVNTGVTAFVVSTIAGFVSTDPDLNTIYLRYQTSGTNGNTAVSAFGAGEVLTVYDANNSVANASIVAGGSGFQNTDSLVFLSSLAVQNSIGGVLFTNTSASACSFVAGQQISGGSSNARAVIVSTNTTANTTAIVLNIKPLASDLSLGNSAAWTFQAGEPISVANGVQSANLAAEIGVGAAGFIVTNGTGAVIDISLTAGGTGYYVAPSLTISSPTGAINTLNLVAENFYQQLTVASTLNPVGLGYAFGVSEGVIYQKGYFSRVSPQVIVVDKYSNLPDGISVGFSTTETIVNAAVDNSLYDNAIGSPNYTAPGANRLELTPTLILQNSNAALANAEFFAIVSWSNGNPYHQVQQTAFNQLENELAKRTFESSGNFVIDPFYVTTTSPTSSNDEYGFFNTVIDPGIAYINGFRVESDFNFVEEVQRGTDSNTINTTLSLDYGNYIRVNQLAGVFLFSTGDFVTLYDTPATYLNSNYANTITPVGNPLGTARIRSLIYESGGDPGTPTAVYRLYLFDIEMNAGANFRNVRSLYYNNTGLGLSGISDVVTQLDNTTNQQIAFIQGSSNNHLVFRVGANAVSQVSNVSYQYRTINSANVNTSGIIAISLTGNGESFPYLSGSNLSPGQDSDIIIIPTANAISPNAAGSIAVTTNSANITGTATSFSSVFNAGDYVFINGTPTGTAVRRVVSVTNATFMSVDANVGFNDATANIALFFPQNVPIPIASRVNRTINVNSAGTLLTINLAANVVANTTMDVAYNVQVANAQPTAKIPKRDLLVQINTGNNSGGVLGPWCLGIPDIFRLKSVYLGNTESAQDITTNFYIDRNEVDGFLDVGYLHLTPQSSLTLANNQTLTIEFDAYTLGTTNGYGFSAVSYLTNAAYNDTLSITDLTTQGLVNTLEIPEFVSPTGAYYDLRDSFDFRIEVTNTAVYTTNVATATMNPLPVPANTKFGNTANTSNNKKFPNPSSGLTSTVTYYLGRADLVTINSNGDFNVIKGTPGSPKSPVAPSNSLVINELDIPPYPSLPTVLSANVAIIADKKIASSILGYERQALYTISIPVDDTQIAKRQPQVYTMTDIATIDQRVRNLEYVVSLNSLQSQLATQTIPSSVDGTQRFKFGFFSDDFSTTNFSALSDPSYNASILNSQLTAKKAQLNLPYEFGPNTFTIGKNAVLPYTEFAIVQQLVATNGPVIPPPPPAAPPQPPAPPVTPPPPPPPVVQTTYNGVYTTVSPGSFTLIGKTTPYAVTATPTAAALLSTLLYSSNMGSGPSLYINADQVFHFHVVGLRPNTVHRFLYNGGDFSNSVTPTGGRLGDPLISGPDGTLDYEFFFVSGITAPASGTTPAAQSQQLAFQQAVSKISGTKTIAVQSQDTLSSAFTTVSFIPPPPPPAAPPAPPAPAPAPIISGGGGGCVEESMWIDGEFTAGDLPLGTMIDSHDYFAPLKREVLKNVKQLQPCVRVVTSGGAKLILSRSTPFEVPEGTVEELNAMTSEELKSVKINGVYATYMVGNVVLTDRGFEEVVAVEDVGMRNVQLISVGGHNYAAGEDAKYRIYSHNIVNITFKKE